MLKSWINYSNLSSSFSPIIHKELLLLSLFSSRSHVYLSGCHIEDFVCVHIDERFIVVQEVLESAACDCKTGRVASVERSPTSHGIQIKEGVLPHCRYSWISLSINISKFKESSCVWLTTCCQSTLLLIVELNSSISLTVRIWSWTSRYIVQRAYPRRATGGKGRSQTEGVSHQGNAHITSFWHCWNIAKESRNCS